MTKLQLLAGTALALGLSLAGSAQAVTITAAGTSANLTPSVDSISFAPSSQSVVPGTFTLQSVTFSVGNSDTLIGTFPYTFTQVVTVDAISQVLNITGSLAVTVCCDTMTLNATGPLQFGNYVLTTSAFTTNGLGVGGRQTFNLQATLSTVPEPATMTLMGAGLLGLGLARRKRD